MDMKVKKIILSAHGMSILIASANGKVSGESTHMPCADPERGTGGPPPILKNHKNIEFLSNTGPHPLKNHIATNPAFNAGPSSTLQRNAI